MSTEENKATMRRIYEVINTGNLVLVDQMLAADLIEHSPGAGKGSGSEGFKQTVSVLRAAFPDLRLTIDSLLAEGDQVVARFTMRGTHRGDFMGIPPTGKSVTVTGFDMVRFAHGKGVEHWASQDDLGMLEQLGLMTMPEQVPV